MAGNRRGDTMSLDAHGTDGSWRRLAVVLGIAAALVASCTGSGRADASHPTFDPDTLAPAQGALLGAWEPPDSDWSVDGQQAAVEDLESSMGRTLAIDHHYYRFTVPFPSWREPWDIANGRTPMISWARTNDADVVSGADDALIRQRADAVRDLGAPVFIRWSWEMDSPAVRGTVGTPEQYVAAWRHVHDLFDHEGAANVRWVWCPNAWAFDTGTGPAYYPGDDVVDWTCADAYNWSPLRPGGESGGKWQDFAPLFDAFYAWASRHDKPIMVGETGTQEAGAGMKAGWIDALRTDLQSRYPAVKALVYFDAVGGSFSGGSFDWRIDTSSSARAAFVALATDPYFNGEAVTTGGPGPLPSPTGLTAAASGTAVNVAWVPAPGSAATTVFRNGVTVAGAVTGTTYRDAGRVPGRTYRYTVAAVDATGNSSAPSNPAAATVPYAFHDGFERGSLGAWRSTGDLAVRRGGTRNGDFAVVADSAGGPASASHWTPAISSGVVFGADFRVDAQGADSALLQVLRSRSGAPLLGTKRRGDGRISLYDYRTGVGVIAPVKVGLGSWHHIELEVDLAGGDSTVEVSVDGHPVDRLSGLHPLPVARIGGVQLGDDRTGRRFVVAFDEVAVHTTD